MGASILGKIFGVGGKSIKKRKIKMATLLALSGIAF